MDALRCENVTRNFFRKRAVDEVSLVLRPGDIYGLVGRNGAGKSTLLKVIAGYIAPTAGVVEIGGEVLGPCQTSARLGCLIEHPAVNPSLSAFQNVMVRALAQGLPDPREAVAAALGAVGLDPSSKERAGRFSLGMKQRLGVALALVGEPSVLLLDEPFNGLDPEGVRLLRELVVRLAQEHGVAVMVSSHVLDQLERMVTRYGVMRDGRLVHEASADEVAAACTDYLCVCAPEAARALAVLERVWPDASFTMMPDDAIRVGAEVDAEEVGRVLLEAQVPVGGLYAHARDIEDYFVGLMGGTAPVREAARTGGTAGVREAARTGGTATVHEAAQAGGTATVRESARTGATAPVHEAARTGATAPVRETARTGGTAGAYEAARTGACGISPSESGGKLADDASAGMSAAGEGAALCPDGEAPGAHSRACVRKGGE